jgi:hypothetical protein
MKKEKETYSVKIICSNCDYGKIIATRLDIEKGHMSDVVIKSTQCPMCACYTLVRQF